MTKRTTVHTALNAAPPIGAVSLMTLPNCGPKMIKAEAALPNTVAPSRSGTATARLPRNERSRGRSYAMSKPSSTITIPDVALHSATTHATTVAMRSAAERCVACEIAPVNTCAAPEGNALVTPLRRLITTLRGTVTRVAMPSRAIMIGKIARNQR